jgi:hypothetical protein
LEAVAARSPPLLLLFGTLGADADGFILPPLAPPTFNRPRFVAAPPEPSPPSPFSGMVV